MKMNFKGAYGLETLMNHLSSLLFLDLLHCGLR